MADGRFVSRRISESEQLASVSLPAALLFTWCIPHLDVEGRMTGNPALLKSKVLPLRPEITEAGVPDLLSELAAAGLVVWYEDGERQYLAFPGFHSSQRGLRKDKEAPSRVPAPDGAGTELVRTKDGLGTELVGAREGKGREVEEKGSLRNAVATPPDNETPTLTTAYKTVLPKCRSLLWAPDGKPPKDSDEARECTVIRELLTRNLTLASLVVLVEGLGYLRRGMCDPERRVEWLEGQKVSLKVLFKSKSGHFAVRDLAEQAYWWNYNREAGKPKTGRPERLDAFPGLPGAA